MNFGQQQDDVCSNGVADWIGMVTTNCFVALSFTFPPEYVPST